jgi:hypothetical protein
MTDVAVAVVASITAVYIPIDGAIVLHDIGMLGIEGSRRRPLGGEERRH